MNSMLFFSFNSLGKHDLIYYISFSSIFSFLFYHALYLLSIKLSMFCNLGYDMNVMEILITNSNSFYFIKNLALL